MGSKGREGARAVVNIAAVHIPSFCDRSKSGLQPAYMNAYDVEAAGVARGDRKAVSKTRQRVDDMLRGLHRSRPEDIYFAAVELDGSGISFYGDVCLVLAKGRVHDDTVVLDRNSYDLVQQPLGALIQAQMGTSEIAHTLAGIAGRWRADVAMMGAIKVVGSDGERERRLTTGQISDRLLDDEDYMEVLKVGSFSATDLEAARLALADVATEDHIEREYANGHLAPGHVSLLWAHQRRKAIAALRKAEVPTNLVRSSGRVKR
ncbi:hypothetical protein QO004_005038 [Rhizobium mesoamericanum]|uniref:hypothetical protein n=1 Tax=Rhizobium mesoamericanum TaxID=1079800 RepID=UPI002781EB4B|nr:hypothetical protein [Rhizobium mesoamericanum]MDQ0563229.1 hypothetical protein [Rhizobium mesoamericanum]